MSDAPQGPGWWQASDGRWYPPTQTPARPDLPPPPAPTWPAAPSWQATPSPVTSPPTKPAKQQSKASSAVAVIFALIMAALVFMCFSGAFKSDDPPKPAGADASAQAACEHFRNIANDASKGILGNDQVLPKMREVYDSASVSDNVAVREAAQRMLADATAGNDGTASIPAMSAACAAIGE